MQSHRKMLSSGTAASSRSANVRSAGTAGAVATVILPSVDSGAEGNARIEIGLSPDEPARHVGERAGIDHKAEPFVRRIGNRHEHGVGLRAREDRLDLGQVSQDRYALEPPAREATIVVGEADDLLARSLA